MSDDQSFEASLAALEKIVTGLESEEVTLEDSIKQYKKGIQLVNRCNDAIDRIEKELEVIQEKKA